MVPEHFACPCCGYLTLDEEPPGTYEICVVCDWEDDAVQFDCPDFQRGANDEASTSVALTFEAGQSLASRRTHADGGLSPKRCPRASSISRHRGRSVRSDRSLEQSFEPVRKGGC
jgi:hypothetical protein